jgi:hypothetical protein
VRLTACTEGQMGEEWHQIGIYTFFYGEWNEDCQLGASLFIHKRQYQQLGEYSLLVTGCRIQY